MTAPPAPAATALHSDRAVRLLAAIRVALVIALTALVLAIAALAYVVSFEAIAPSPSRPPISHRSWPGRRPRWSTASPPRPAWSSSGATCAVTPGERPGTPGPWYAWTLVAAATAVSVALNVAHAPDRLAAQLFAALPPVALLGALELLMSVARTGLPHTSRGGRDRRGRHRS